MLARHLSPGDTILHGRRPAQVVCVDTHLIGGSEVVVVRTETACAPLWLQAGADVLVVRGRCPIIDTNDREAC